MDAPPLQPHLAAWLPARTPATMRRGTQYGWAPGQRNGPWFYHVTCTLLPPVSCVPFTFFLPSPDPGSLAELKLWISLPPAFLSLTLLHKGDPDAPGGGGREGLGIRDRGSVLISMLLCKCQHNSVSSDNADGPTGGQG